jgi:hypothetical protein
LTTDAGRGTTIEMVVPYEPSYPQAGSDARAI